MFCTCGTSSSRKSPTAESCKSAGSGDGLVIRSCRPAWSSSSNPVSGTLPAPVSDVIDVLAVGEPIELAALTRITDAAAVEEAETRGLITLEPAGARHRGAGGASALWTGTPEACGAHPATTAARTGGLRTRSIQRPRRHRSRRAPRHVESRLRPHARCRPAREGSARRGLAGRPPPRRPTGGSGDTRRSRRRTQLCSGACIVVAWARRRGGGHTRRDPDERVDRSRPRQMRVPAVQQHAVGAW